MTQDEIIRMAEEAGLAFGSDEYPDIWQTYMNVGREEIERFAALVAAHEREKCAKSCEALINEETCYVWIPDAKGAVNKCAETIRSIGEKPVTVPANGLLAQEPSRDAPTDSQSNEIVPVGYVDAMFQFQTCQEHHVSPSDRFKPVYTAEQIEAAVLAEREACAKVCESDEMRYECSDECAAAIRARGE